MPREVITLQVGQCGNQIGRRFWELALAEHAGDGNGDAPGRDSSQQPLEASYRAAGQAYNDSMSSFFHLCPDGRTVKARAVLVDAEEGPVSETLRGPLGGLFDARQSITDVSGAGNNFAHGHHVYGPRYGDSILEAVREAAELCDSLQSFFLMHSLGGGTGSGLGTYILGLLEDAFPDVHRFVSAVFPSPDDDVVTSPYNSMLALHQLTQHADCVLPVENQSLAQLLEQHPVAAPSFRSTSGSTVRGRMLAAAKRQEQTPEEQGPQQQGHGQQRRCGFDEMNGVMARVLIDLTASMRFAGDLNVDLNEVTTNLVPYPRMHYLMSSLSHPRGAASPSVQQQHQHQHGPLGGGGLAQQTSLQLGEACEGVFSRRNQLMRADPRQGTVLACALLFRGQELSLSDVTSNVQRLQGQLRMVPWNREGFKIGLCSRASGGPSAPGGASPPSPSLLCLSNNSCMASTFGRFGERFQRLFKRRAMVHHYTQYMETARFDQAYEDLRQLVDDYRGLDGDRPRPRIPGGAPALSLPVSRLFFQ